MLLLNLFDVDKEFFSSNPHMRILLKDYLKVPSRYLWAVFLYAHPESKFFELSPQDRKNLIYHDYLLQDPEFSWEAYAPLIEHIESHLLTRAQRSLTLWEKTLHERDEFLASIPYSLDTWEVKDKLMANSSKL